MYVSATCRRQIPDWRRRFQEAIDAANVRVATIPMRLELAGEVDWLEEEDVRLDAALEALEAGSREEGGRWLLGLLASHPSARDDLDQTMRVRRFGRHGVLRLDADGRAQMDARVLVHALGHLLGAVHTRDPSAMRPTGDTPNARGFDRPNRLVIRAVLAAMHAPEGSAERASYLRRARRYLHAADAPGWDERDRNVAEGELAQVQARAPPLVTGLGIRRPEPHAPEREPEVEASAPSPEVARTWSARAPRSRQRGSWRPLFGPLLALGSSTSDFRPTVGLRLELGVASTRGIGIAATGHYERGGAGRTVAGGGLSLHVLPNAEPAQDVDDPRGALALSVGFFRQFQDHAPDAQGVSVSAFAGFRSLFPYSIAGGLRADVRASLAATTRYDVIVTLEIDPMILMVLVRDGGIMRGLVAIFC